MTDVPTQERAANAWLVVDAGGTAAEFPYPDYVVELEGDRNRYQALAEGDWLLIASPSEFATKVARVMRVRSNLKRTTLYFDRLLLVDAPVALKDIGLSSPAGASVSRIQWSTFIGALPKLGCPPVGDVPLIGHQAYVRELLQLAVVDDLLGPANGPREQILDMGVRDRYLVGKLAPRESGVGGRGDGIEGLEGALAAEDEEEPDDLKVHSGRHDPGAEFDGTTGRVDAEAEATDEFDAASNQSLVPSSLGLTFCVDGDVSQLEVEARWGRYVRVYDHEHTKTINRKIRDDEGNVVGTEQAELKIKVWQRVPCGGTLPIDLVEGVMPYREPDPEHPEVRVQGTVRGKNQNGDRLVTLFLVNTQREPSENKDSAWVFQPELVVRATMGSRDSAIFRRRAPLPAKDDDERRALEMIYRQQVEFAVGHGVSVHATTDSEDPERATEIRTAVLPQYEVPVTETPGGRAEDRPAMCAMVDRGYLDMEVLAGMSRADLVAALSELVGDYKLWIDEQAARITDEMAGHEAQAEAAIARCTDIKKRLEEGVAVLADEKNEKALVAFRFANRAMAKQRIHSLYALSRRRGEEKSLASFEERRNRSWRPFQLAFILLSMPALADPSHKDRTEALEAFADLLWFPTGGGKTEAYLGVAAFAMAIRRLQGNLGGYDSSRGLTVIMRYTLRLLTLQQFQRGSALICAMELMRQEAEAAGDHALGSEPFTIGLWVGNKVTPGTTEDSHRAIQDIRNPDRFDAGGTSPAQLTSCPWCGCEVSPKQDVEVDTAAKRTVIYCGDKKGQCDFSKGKSSKKPHPGIPVLVVDEEIYHRPPSMMIATVDKFALMAWRGEVRTLFGRAIDRMPPPRTFVARCRLHRQSYRFKGLPKTAVKKVNAIRPPT